MRKWYLFLAISVVLFFAFIPILGQIIDKEPFGIDISHHNGSINWKQVPIVEFVYIKATEGATYVDPMFQHNLKRAKANKKNNRSISNKSSNE